MFCDTCTFFAPGMTGEARPVGRCLGGHRPGGVYATSDACADWRRVESSPPGETLQDLMDERNLSFEFIAGVIGLGDDAAYRILTGRREIDLQVARRLASYELGTAEFWLAREDRFQASQTERAVPCTGGEPRG